MINSLAKHYAQAYDLLLKQYKGRKYISIADIEWHKQVQEALIGIDFTVDVAPKYPNQSLGRDKRELPYKNDKEGK